MKTRIISALVLLPFFAYIITKGGLLLVALTLGLSLLALREFFNLFGEERNILMEICTYAVTIITQIVMQFTQSSRYFLLMMFLIIGCGAILFIAQKLKTKQLAVSLLGYVYISICFSHLVLIDILGETMLVWLVFIIAFSTDTFAYFVGIKFGRHKLAPVVSPKKSIEGSLGGIIGCILCGIIYALVCKITNIPGVMLICLFGSIVSQIGDLFASAMKREYGIKDYGNIIPGHGGILDRFDSSLFVIPIVYYGVLLLNII